MLTDDECDVCSFVLESKMSNQPFLCAGISRPEAQRVVRIHAQLQRLRVAASLRVAGAIVSAHNVCCGLRFSVCSPQCVKVLESLMWWLTNEVYWTNYGCEKHNADGSVQWLRPCPASGELPARGWSEHMSLCVGVFCFQHFLLIFFSWASRNWPAAKSL